MQRILNQSKSAAMRVVSALMVTYALIVVGCASEITTAVQEPGRNMAADGRAGRTATTSAFEALETGNHASFLDYMIQADSLRPAHPALRFHLARAFALNGQHEKAVDVLSSLNKAGMRVRLDDAAFSDLLSMPGFARASAPIDAHVDSRMVFRGQDADTQPEGLIRSGDGWMLGSVHQARIVGPDEETWASTEGYSAMGMERHAATIWSAQTMTPEGGAPDSLVGRSRLVGYDAGSGQVVATAAPSDTLDHWFGDLTVSPDGSVFISDSRAPGIYRFFQGVLEPLIVGDPFQSPQGIAWMDGHLYVADYSAGIFRVDPESGAVVWLETPDNAVLLGIDGLEPWAAGHALLGIQNGTNPTRVVRIVLAEEGIARVEALDVDHPDHSDPTLGLVENDTLFYVANSQWPLFSDGADASRRQAPVILGLPLLDR